MLEIKFIRQKLAEVEKALSARGATADLDLFKKCDDRRRNVLAEIEELRHRRNVVSPTPFWPCIHRFVRIGELWG